MTDIPDTLKTHNWTLYEQSMAADPSVACQFIVKLLTSLMITMKMAEIHDYDGLLEHETLGARRAWKEYNDNDSGRAMQTVTVVLSRIGFLLYDERFAIAKAQAFTGRQ
jgi:hypothetical protein